MTFFESKNCLLFSEVSCKTGTSVYSTGERLANEIYDKVKQGKISLTDTSSGAKSRSSISNNINIISMPGPTAVITALTGSGLPTDKFHFHGFLPKKGKELIDVLNECSNLHGTSIFYETPHRLIASLELIDKIYSSEVNLCIAKELTKLHENFFRGTPKDLLQIFYEKKELIKGEFVLLMYFKKKRCDYSNADKIYKNLEFKISINEISKLASDITGINKNLLYKRFLSFSQKS